MELNYTKKEKLAGLFVIVTAIFLLIALVMIGRGKDWFKRHVTYYTTFTESYNLQEDAAVKLLETKVGKVKTISLLQDRVKVELVIWEDYASRIRMGSVAKVESPTLIGSEYISIKPGKKDALLIPEGGLIPSTGKKSFADILKKFPVEKIAGMLVLTVQNISEIIQIMRASDGPLFQTLDDINRAAGHIEAITGNLRAGKGTVGALLKSDELLNTIREDLGKAGNILDHVAEASAKLPSHMDQVGNILDYIEKASAQAPQTMDQVQDNLVTFKKAGEEVVNSVAQIKNILKAVEKNLATFKVILKNIEESSFDIPEITQSVREEIKAVKVGIENFNNVVKSLQKNFLIRKNIPPEPIGETTDAGLRE